VNDMQEFEAEFCISEKPGRDAKPQACRECYKEPAINSACKGCSERDGVCLRCIECSSRWANVMTLGMMDAWCRHDYGFLTDVCSGFSHCSLCTLLTTMTIRAGHAQTADLQSDGSTASVSEWAQCHIRKVNGQV
jgi:hypothetical protein